MKTSRLPLLLCSNLLLITACGRGSEGSVSSPLSAGAPQHFWIDTTAAPAHSGILTMQLAGPSALLRMDTRKGTALYFHSDSAVCSLRKEKDRWRITDTFSIPFNLDLPGQIDFPDLNGDDLRDCRIMELTGHAGNMDCRVLLYDPLSRSFRRNPHFDLVNVEYDGAARLVRSSWLGERYSNSKQTWKISGDSLLPHEELRITIGDDPPYTYTLAYLQNINGTLKQTALFEGSAEDIRRRFDTGLAEKQRQNAVY